MDYGNKKPRNAGVIGDTLVTHPVGLKEPNALGLYDMSGNVDEWIWDKFCNDYQLYDSNDPHGQECESLYNVVRGGNWHHQAKGCRSAQRGDDEPQYRAYNIGFRLTRTNPKP